MSVIPEAATVKLKNSQHVYLVLFGWWSRLTVLRVSGPRVKVVGLWFLVMAGEGELVEAVFLVCCVVFVGGGVVELWGWGTSEVLSSSVSSVWSEFAMFGSGV